MLLLDDFLFRALLGGIAIAAVAGPLGCFVVWQRMAYFGDSLAHGAILGVALGFFLNIDITVGIIVICLFIALLLAMLQRQNRLSSDTLLGIFSHTSLALGLIAISLMHNVRVDLFSYLFGDILAVGKEELIWIYLISAGSLLAFAYIWRGLVAATVHEELAYAEGINIGLVKLIFIAIIALVIATAMRLTGVLLITSLLILPSAAARRFSSSPEQMAILSAFIGAAEVVAGILASNTWDIPSGPAIVVAGAGIFAFSLIIRPKAN